MDWLDRMNLAMDYIEDHLTEDVDFDHVARLACCSTYHFQRMFSFITNVPLSEYIRRRRLTMAAFELRNTGAKVIDLAFKFGYESPEAFSRAFSKLHGVSPLSARDKGVVLKAYPRMSFHISIKGDSEMNWRIEEKEAFEVFGLELQTNVIDGQCYRDIPVFWEACARDGRDIALAEAAGKKRDELLDAGIIYDRKPDGSVKYMIACVKPAAAVSPEFAVLSIPKQTWAVLCVEWQLGAANDKLHDTWRRIYSEWFPLSSYEHAECDCDMERYFGNAASGYGVEVWIPVVKK